MVGQTLSHYRIIEKIGQVSTRGQTRHLRSWSKMKKEVVVMKVSRAMILGTSILLLLVSYPDFDLWALGLVPGRDNSLSKDH